MFYYIRSNIITSRHDFARHILVQNDISNEASDIVTKSVVLFRHGENLFNEVRSDQLLLVLLITGFKENQRQG